MQSIDSKLDRRVCGMCHGFACPLIVALDYREDLIKTLLNYSCIG